MGHYYYEETKEIIELTLGEIDKLSYKSSNYKKDYWGSEKNVENEGYIVNFLFDNNIVDQEFFDDRLKHTSVEMLEDILEVLYLDYLEENDEDEKTRDEYINFQKKIHGVTGY
jgi:hypothetical protein|tara:strand:- start:2 stop:340 length:339 start_codon:yes stop_codon:yes gene_type:complete